MSATRTHTHSTSLLGVLHSTRSTSERTSSFIGASSFSFSCSRRELRSTFLETFLLHLVSLVPSFFKAHCDKVQHGASFLVISLDLHVSHCFIYSFFCVPHTPALPPFSDSVVLCSVYEHMLCASMWQLPSLELIHVWFCFWLIICSVHESSTFTHWYMLCTTCSQSRSLNGRPSCSSIALLTSQKTHCVLRPGLLRMGISDPSRIHPVPCLLRHGDCTLSVACQ